MTTVVGLNGEYLWSDGTRSTLAPNSRPLDDILANPTQFVPGGVADGVAINCDKIYETQPFIAAGINLLAGQIARLPLKAFIATLVESEGTDAYTTRKRDRKSALAKALRNPSPRRSSFHLKWDIAFDLKINGNHLERILWTRGGMNLQPIPWRYAQPILNEAADQILGWRISRPGEDVEVLSNLDVAHFARGTTLSGLGVSPLVQLGVTVQLERAAQAYQIATMRNQARLGVVVEIDAEHYRDPEIRESIRQEFHERYAGPKNAGRPYVATGVDVHTVPQQTTVDADLIKQRVIAREEAAAILGVPTLFMGDASKATQNNVEEMHKQLYKTTIAPDLELICATFGSHVIDEHPRSVASPETYVEFDVSAILSGDPIERARSYQLLQQVGGITINEIRDRENMARFPYPWADLPLLPVNNVQPAAQAFEEHPDDDPEGEGDEPPEDPEEGDE